VYQERQGFGPITLSGPYSVMSQCEPLEVPTGWWGHIDHVGLFYTATGHAKWCL